MYKVIHLSARYLKHTFLALCMLFLFIGAASAQIPDCACPVKKGVIIIDMSYVKTGGKVIPFRDINGKKREVYSASDGEVLSIDTILKNKYFVRIGLNDFTFRYTNLLTVSCVAGQQVRKGDKIGEMEKGIDLIFGLSDGNRYLEPEKYLPCRKRVVGN